jgi:hypothetical protein
MKQILGSALALMLLAAGPVMAGAAGDYAVEGENPGGSGSYSGTVKVVQTGPQTFEVRWRIGNTTFVGTGVGDDQFLSVGYKSGGSNYGVALYVASGGSWQGVWAYGGAKEIGKEVWHPR